MKKLLILLSVLVAASCSKPQAHTFGASGGTASPIIPASWAVPAWFVDPANVSTTASDSNNCTSISTPCLTWQEINVHRWGCGGSPAQCPRLRQNTAIEFISSASNNSDPVYFNPTIEAGAIIQIFGPLGAAQQVATGVLSNVTAKNRATPQLLLAQSGATAPGQFVVNSTHPSNAWTYKLSSGSIYSMTEPSVAAVVPSFSCGTPVDTWTNGDSVTVYQPVAVNISSISATFDQGSGAGSNTVVYVYNVSIFDPGTFNTAYLYNSTMFESSSSRYVAYGEPYNGATFCNSEFLDGVQATSDTLPTTFNAGAVDYGATFTAWAVSNTSFNNDVILRGDILVRASGSKSGPAPFGSGGGPAYLDTSTVFTVAGAFLGTGGIWWGPGTINVNSSGRFNYTSPAATNLIVTTLQLNGGTTGHTVNTAANVDVPCGGITVNKANLDAANTAVCASTGFGGLAFNPGGASFIAGTSE